MNVTVILPTYNPTERIFGVVGELSDAGLDDIVIIDDGSRGESSEIFSRLEENPACTVIHHDVNKGKGRGLKTGFEFFLKNRPDYDGVVTTDDDGQHRPEDILRCAERMASECICVFGARDFNAVNVPKKSRCGNKLTRFVFRHFCGIKITDTQTGLRAIPRKYIGDMLETSGERFEYETHMLLEMKQRSIPFAEEPIQTVYINANSETHFNPLTDSLKIYAVIAKFMLSSLSCSIIDLGAFTLLNLGLIELFGANESGRVLVATVAARVISSLVNFTLNRRRVFKAQNNIAKAMLKYYILCVIQLLVSFLCVSGLTMLFSAEQSLWQSLIKMVIDTILFFISFRIQRDWVYK